MLFGCGDECPPIACSPAVIVTGDLAVAADEPLEGSIRLCHVQACLEQVIAFDPADPPELTQVTFPDSFTSARFVVADGTWTVEAEVHPGRPEGYFAGDVVSVLVRDAAGATLLAHEGAVSDKLENDACGLPCAIQRVEI